MVGSELPSPQTSESTVTDRQVLRLDGVGVVDAAGRPLLEEISLSIRAGEVLGLAGVEGNGQAELVETIIGMRVATSGRVQLGDDDVTGWSTRRRREAGVGFIPEDRQRHGLLMASPLWENRILGHQTVAPNVRGPLIDRPRRPHRHRADRDRVRRAHAVHRCGRVRRSPAATSRS